MTNLYSVTRFKLNGFCVQNERKQLMTTEQMQSAPWFYSKSTHANDKVILDLKPGDSTVILDDSPQQHCGWRITRLPDFAINQVLFDRHAKEYVVVTNGECMLDHSSPEAFERSHYASDETAENTAIDTYGCSREVTRTRLATCSYSPSEAIALRPFISNGKIQLAWTYRAVDPCELESVSNAEEIKRTFEDVLARRRSKTFIGRV